MSATRCMDEVFYEDQDRQCERAEGHTMPHHACYEIRWEIEGSTLTTRAVVRVEWSDEPLDSTHQPTTISEGADRS